MLFLKYNLAFLKTTDFKIAVNLEGCDYLNLRERAYEEAENRTMRRLIRKLSSNLKKTATYSEMLAPFYHNLWHHIPMYS
jgi:hypothetical protein